MALAMTDRLGALHGGQNRSTADYLIMEEEEESDVDKVLLTADELTKLISKIKKTVQQIKENNNAMLTAYNNQGAKERNESLNQEIKNLTRKIHAQFKRMKADIESEERGSQRNSADLRIKKAQFNTLSRLLNEAMEEYHNEQESYRDKSKDRIQKQLQYAGRRVNEDELETMLESDDTNIFTQDILLVTAQKKAALGECEARHQELLRLEQNIKELHDMFYDMALLVEEQGELIDRIENNVENANVYVYHGRQRLKQAVEMHSSNRKMKWAICIILCCCCTVIVLAGIAGGGYVAYIRLRDNS